jgi:hypothetical protein
MANPDRRPLDLLSTTLIKVRDWKINCQPVADGRDILFPLRSPLKSVTPALSIVRR